jgi:LPXTG-motif cell wall-anchored protein
MSPRPRRPTSRFWTTLVATAAALVLIAQPASAAPTSFAVTNVVTALQPGTCPPNFFGNLAVGQSSSGTSTLDITGNTATQTLASNGLVLSGPVNGNDVSVAVERPVTSGSTTFTERRESTFTVSGTTATGTSKLTVTFPNGGTCSADFALTGTLGAPLIPDQATTTIGASTTAPATTAPAATTAAPATTVPAGPLPATGFESSTIVAVGAVVAAAGAALLIILRGKPSVT